MNAKRLDGKALAATIREGLGQRVKAHTEAGGRAPGLATVLVGDDPASHVYVRSKRRACDAAGMVNVHRELPADADQAEVLKLIEALNQDKTVDGILVQLPLPAGMDENKVLAAVDPNKDVDGFHPVNQGRLLQGQPGLRPCTPVGIMRLLQETGASLKGAHAVVVGRSNIVGKPVALMLLEQHATVTLCHSRTRDLAAEVQRADVVVAAVGVPQLIQGSWIRDGAVVIDVGINRNEEGKLVGDVEFESASARASWITPVPGGVGPMTIAMLLQNTVDNCLNGASSS
ncbi:MAG: bifunctional methylenetetrahydrofolate dehydrogenase/methenyltetrahydrofolate cyclohydrolase FolD [Planctomycetota bacterium]|nr:MAG: bifunctional methylenetetrahydrofolate dehydrogenase/methenyltetrahydrofolate cyclohydrolase FolD [Planctomycetota bacterium]